MKKSVVGVGGVLLLVIASFAAQKPKTFTGEIMDSQCAKNGSHDMMLKKEGMEKMIGMPEGKKMCTMNCVKNGGKYVLYDSATKKVYALDDQTKPAEFAGQNVKVTGTLAKGAIHVTDISAAS